MITSPFKEAQQAVAQKKLLPTTLSHEELGQIDADIRERALFSARVANARFLQEVKDKIQELLKSGASPESVRAELQEFLQKLSYAAPEGKEGTIQDLSSDARINLIVATQLAMANGFGRWKQGQTRAILNAWPAQEFYRAEERVEPRNWPERWAAAGGIFFPGSSDYPQGRMIALKNSPIWVRISAFELPYPPFDFNSGMSVRDVDREVAIKLGLMEEDDEFEPEKHNFAASTESDVASLDPQMKKALLASLGPEYKVDKHGVLHKKVQNRDGWIGVDFDGTLCKHYEGKWEPGKLGEPVPQMLERVKAWMKEGRWVKIFTARANNPTDVIAIEQWLVRHGIGGLEVTNKKSPSMHELWDDRAVAVERDTGEQLSGAIANAERAHKPYDRHSKTGKLEHIKAKGDYLKKVQEALHEEGAQWVPLKETGGVEMVMKDPKGGVKTGKIGATFHLPSGKPVTSIKHLAEIMPKDAKAIARDKKKAEKLKTLGAEGWMNEMVADPHNPGKKVARKTLFKSEDHAWLAYNMVLAKANALAKMKHTPIAIPPNWEHPHVNLNPEGTNYAKGYAHGQGAAGTVAKIQNPRHVAEAASEKFERGEKLLDKINAIEKKLVDMSYMEVVNPDGSYEASKPDCAAAMLTQWDTGMRVGSSGEKQLGKHKSFGLLQLQAKHVKVTKLVQKKGITESANVTLEFTGKGGKPNSIKVNSIEVIKELVYRKQHKKPNDLLFGPSYNFYMTFKDEVAVGYKSHDIRLAKASQMAQMEVLWQVKQHGYAKDEKQFLKMQREAAKNISKQLGNSPKQVIESYVIPSIWQGLKKQSAK